MLPQFPSNVSCAGGQLFGLGSLESRQAYSRPSAMPDLKVPWRPAPASQKRIRVGLEPPLGSLFLNSDPCPCGVISRRVLSAMSGHSMSHVWLLPTDCPGRSRHLNVPSKRWCAPRAAWPCYSCLGRMRGKRH